MIIRPYPGFIIPTRRFVDVGVPTSRVTCKGRYMLRVIDAATGGVVRETPWFDNIILDSGLNRWGTGTIISGAAIGTGTSTPAATDTGLQAQTTFTSTGGDGAGIVLGVSPNFNNTRTFVYRTALGALDGNYTEVGVGWATGSMFSRALIVDGGGNPTSIAVTSAQQLDIFYQLSIYPPLTDWTDTVTISGVDYEVTGRACRVSTVSGFSGGWAVTFNSAIVVPSSWPGTLFSGDIGEITAAPSGNSGSVAATNFSYSNNSLQKEASHTAALGSANFAGGVRSAVVQWGSTAPTWFAAFQYQFQPTIPKDSTRTLALNYRVSWARR